MKTVLSIIGGLLLGFLLILSAEKALEFRSENLIVRGENLVLRTPSGWSDRKYIDDTSETIYDVKYTTPSRFQRFTPPTQKSPSRYAVFVGCSFAFGVGGNDDQTLPYYFEKNAPGYRAYNFGERGFGPNQNLRTAQEENLQDIVKENSGYVIYYFTDIHLARALARWSFIGHGAKEQPYFKQTGTGDLRYLGNFADVFPLQTKLAAWFAQSQIVQYFKMEWPPKYSQKDIKYFVNVVGALRAEYKKKLPKAKFLVLLYPGSQFAERLVPEFEAANIYYLDYSRLDVWGAVDKFEYPHDGHPTPAAHEFVGMHLAAALTH